MMVTGQKLRAIKTSKSGFKKHAPKFPDPKPKGNRGAYKAY